MSDRIALEFLACAVAVETAVDRTDAGRPNWMKILPAGTFTLRDGRGPFASGDLTSMRAIVARTAMHWGSTELMVDYDHQSHFAAKPGIGGTAKAAGWIKELQARPDGIWARVEWTDTAASAIQAKEYRYLSPLFGSDRAGNVTIIANVGLVNTPAMDLAAVAASLSGEIGEEVQIGMGPIIDLNAASWKNLKGSTMEQIAQVLGLSQTAAPDEILAAATSVVAARDKLMTAAGFKSDGNPDDAAKAIADAVQAAKGNPNPASFVPLADFEAVVKEANSLRSGMGLQAARTRVDETVRAGQLPPFLKEWAVGLCTSNAAAFDGFIERTGATVAAMFEPQLGDRHIDRSGAGNTLSDSERAVCTNLGLSADDFNKSRPNAGIDQE